MRNWVKEFRAEQKAYLKKAMKAKRKRKNQAKKKRQVLRKLVHEIWAEEDRKIDEENAARERWLTGN